jgi:hypothetical protein
MEQGEVVEAEATGVAALLQEVEADFMAEVEAELKQAAQEQMELFL